MSTLQTLPADVLTVITTHLSASALAALSSTCRLLHDFTASTGWRIYTQTHFPSFHHHLTHHHPAAPTTWHSHAASQTLLSRHWQHRTFTARIAWTATAATAAAPRRRGGRGGRGGGQTLAGRCILSLSPATGTLLVASGAALLHATDSWRVVCTGVEGAGDIVGLAQLPGGSGAVVARADGGVEVVGLDTGAVRARWDAGRGLRGMAAAEAGGGRAVVVVVGEGGVKIVPLQEDGELREEEEGTETELPGTGVWTAAWIKAGVLAVGETGERPIRIWDVERATRIRDIGLDGEEGKRSSVYAISPLPACTGGSGHGQVFLSGWYDGVARLHDLRTPTETVTEYTDPIDALNPIYTLSTISHTHIVTGSARHSVLKAFDLRMPPSSSSSSSGWGTYLRPQQHKRQREEESAVYSLAVPADGGKVYAGMRGGVWEVSVGGAKGGVGVVMYGMGGGLWRWGDGDGGGWGWVGKGGEGRWGGVV